MHYALAAALAAAAAAEVADTIEAGGASAIAGSCFAERNHPHHPVRNHRPWRTFVRRFSHTFCCLLHSRPLGFGEYRDESRCRSTSR